MEWRPIDTAPKDGTAILVARWGEEEAEWFIDLCDAYDGEFDAGHTAVSRALGEVMFSHWMPLPPPPSGAM